MLLKCSFVFLSFTTFLNIAEAKSTITTTKPASPCIKVAIEGMPGAGKTSTILHLASSLEGKCVVLSELQPQPQSDLNILPSEKQSRIYHDLWVARLQIVEKLSPYTPCFVFDRTYFTNLAFSYATDKFLYRKKYAHKVLNKELYIKEPPYHKGYSEHKKLFLKELSKNTFDVFIVLDVLPKTGLARRHKINDEIPWMHSEEIWLSFLREFYLKELPKFYKGKIIYIETEYNSKDETIQQVKEELKSITPLENKKAQFTPNQEDMIVKFAEIHKLGNIRSSLISVYGYPTIYYRKYSIQLVDGNIKWLNTSWLEEIYSKMTEKE